MSPKKRNKENHGLPARWRHRYGAYYYRVPSGMEPHWDNKKEFRLGESLSEAHRIYADRIELNERMETMRDLFQRYRLEVIPTKAKATQRPDINRLITLETIFGDNPATSVTTQHCYQVLDALTNKKSASAANKHIALLSHVFTYAIRWGVIAEHPIKGKLVKNKVKTSVRVPERSEIEESLKAAPAIIRAYVRFKVLTGLRQADILTLRKDALKSDGIHVTPRKTQGSSGKSIIIEWDDRGFLSSAVAEIKALPRPVHSMYLFCTRDGQPYFKDGDASGFQSIWQRWMKKALSETNLKTRFTERSIRTFVGSESESTEEAARLLNHADTKTTRAHYRKKPTKVRPLLPQNKDSMGGE